MIVVKTPRRSRRLVAAGALAIAFGAVGLANAESPRINLVAYSTPQEAYRAIVPLFQRTPLGKGVTVVRSFGGSGDQSRAVAAGLPADVVAFSLSPDVDRLVKADLVASDYKRNAFNGNVTTSLVVFVVRKGNPKRITTWDDLVKPGVDVITPNWQTSGGAKWNILAAYGAQLKRGRSASEAADYLKALYKNVSVQDKSARESLQTFLGGKGDVLLAYENEALYAKGKGEKIDFVTPAETILIENPIAVISTSSKKPRAEAFVRFTRSAPAQETFAKFGYRPVLTRILKKYAKRFPIPSGLFNVAGLGGWDVVNNSVFDPGNGIVAKAQRG